jgi:WD40 repeat protein
MKRTPAIIDGRRKHQRTQETQTAIRSIVSFVTSDSSGNSFSIPQLCQTLHNKLLEKQLVACNTRNKILILDLVRHKIVKELVGSDHQISCMIKLKDNSLVSGSYDGEAIVWHFQKDERSVCKVHQNPIDSMIEIGDRLVTAGAGFLSIHRIKEDHSLEEVYQFYYANVQSLTVLNDDHFAFYDSKDRTIKIFDIVNMRVAKSFSTSFYCYSIQALSESTLVAICGVDQIFWNWTSDLVTNRASRKPLYHIIPLNDEKYIADYQHQLELRDIYENDAILQTACRCDAISKLDEYRIVTRSDECLQVWNITSLSIVEQYAIPRARSVCILPM